MSVETSPDLPYRRRPDQRSWYWELSVDTTAIGLERLARAMLLCGGLVSSITVWPGFPLGRGVSASLMVRIPDGQEDRFRVRCRPITMEPPQLIQVGTQLVIDDGHPGRKR